MQIQNRIRTPKDPPPSSYLKGLEEELSHYTMELSKLINKGLSLVDNFLVPHGVHHSKSITYISGSGAAGTDNSAETLKTVILPANTLTQLGDRLRVRTYWAGTTGSALTGTVTINGVPISDTTDSGGATFQLNDSWLHYIDATHANIIEHEGGGLGNFSAPNVAGFNWAAEQNIVFSQSAALNNHAILYALLVDVMPKGAS